MAELKPASGCCSPAEAAACCEPGEKEACCGEGACGCDAGEGADEETHRVHEHAAAAIIRATKPGAP
jgi:hypothetical protein